MPPTPPTAPSAARTLLLGLALLSAALCGAVGCRCVTESTPDAAIRDDDRACEHDADCVVVDADGCGCASGGSATAIARDAVDDVTARRESGAGAVGHCSTILSSDDTCRSAAAIGVGGVCELVGECH